jgi:hypothetical protein
MSAELQARFDAVKPTKPKRPDGGSSDTLVLNLGMNGMLPADLETLVDSLLPIRPDRLVIDVGLRSFSADFTKHDTLYSRSWLRPSSAGGGLLFDKRGLLAQSGQTGAIERVLLNNWATYRVRDILRARYIGGEPAGVVSRLRDELEGKSGGADGGPGAEMRLLMQVRSRYASANLDPANLQVAAFSRMIRKMKAANQRAVVFYATESPRLRGSLMEPQDYDPLITKLRQLVEAEGGGLVTYLPANLGLDDSMFLDHVHVDAKGNRIYAETLFNALKR